MPGWLKFVIALALLAAVAVSLAIFFTQDLVKAADGQLGAIRSRDYSRAYYEYTAKDFKASTSLEAFMQFVKTHPALSNNESANFNERSIENNVGTLHGTLVSKDGGVTPIEYKFVKEGDNWRILSMRLVPTGAVSTGVEGTRVSELVEPVEAQLAAFRSNDVAKAYFGYVSRDFQETTPLKGFRDFVQNYPILVRHRSTTFTDGQIDGKEGSIEAVLHGDQISTSVEYKLKKEDGKWKIWSMRLKLPTDAVAKEASGDEVDQITAPIEALLAYLRASELHRAYYEYASREFQSATSPDAFRDFVRAYPALSEHKTALLEKPTLHEDTSTIVATLTSPNGTTPVEFQLIRDGKNWKMWSMQILSKTANGANTPSFSTAELVNTIEGQLTAIREGDLSRAYYAYTSKEFQRSTSMDGFEKFVASHPALSRNQVANFTNLSFKNDVGTFRGLLTADNDKSISVEYDLVYEDGKWRIVSIQLQPTNEGKPAPRKEQSSKPIADNAPTGSAQPRFSGQGKNETTRMDITKLIVGSEVDSEGRVNRPARQFTPDTSDIHADLFVKNATAGAHAELILEHTDSRTRVPAVRATIEVPGDAILSYIFTAPAHGWPKGTYRLVARTSNGKEREQEFKVE